MRSFVRFCMVSIVLVALAFFCEGLRVNFLAGTDTGTTVRTSTDSLTDPTQSEHSFIKTELDFRILESKAFCHLNVQRHSLPTLRKLRL